MQGIVCAFSAWNRCFHEDPGSLHASVCFQIEGNMPTAGPHFGYGRLTWELPLQAAPAYPGRVNRLLVEINISCLCMCHEAAESWVT